ncbi:preprotein translocase subunit SecE [Ramlibacter sp. AW1]|uniref:Protein translocase subunit SecE n=1 Tax=Ramlibacter aurantiacus TaxID=2801330 RepID=A0A936ZU62_9BURK|nr:preprotein translocase subunit SecE [Ramlibacter aurantiacus]MBL0422621.1 preprotein translocase subunit SecE [Ramlibacter aurantiacus]
MASSQVETVGSGAEKAKLAVAVLLVVAGVAGFYLLGRQGPVVQWGALVLAIIGAVGVFFTSDSGKELGGFAQDAWREVKKVVWPTRKESIQVTAYVFGFVVVMAIFLWTSDKVIEWVFYDLILRWR